MKWNVVSNEGERTSVTVFFGSEQFLATSEHPNFTRICAELETKNPNEQYIKELFDTGIALERKFTRVSERVMIKQGHVYFDGVLTDNAISDAILRFQWDGQEDFMPLVNFMEKIATNPNEHSREHLFRWLSKHKFALHPDGDFIAYKGVREDGRSITGGSAIVNGVEVEGLVPNEPGTVIEMPRDRVTFDPSQGCSVGLHAGNWRYARNFAQGRTLRVKINPRDVVSVPTDSNDEKLRVCRYRVLGEVSAEDKTTLVLTPDKTKRIEWDEIIELVDPASKAKRPARKRAAKPKVEVAYPEYYEEYNKQQMMSLNLEELRWLANEWDLTIPRRDTKEQVVTILLKEARRRRRTW